jgi:hypothetical protein
VPTTDFHSTGPLVGKRNIKEIIFPYPVRKGKTIAYRRATKQLRIMKKIGIEEKKEPGCAEGKKETRCHRFYLHEKSIGKQDERECSTKSPVIQVSKETFLTKKKKAGTALFTVVSKGEKKMKTVYGMTEKIKRGNKAEAYGRWSRVSPEGRGSPR